MGVHCPNCTTWYALAPLGVQTCCGLRLLLRADGSPWMRHARDWAEEQARPREAGPVPRHGGG